MSTQRPYVTNIHTTVKGPKRSVEIGQRTLVVGETASGKSAIGQSLQLIYSGGVDGIDGRDDVKGSRLARLAGAGLPLTVEALYSDGIEASYAMAEGGGRGDPVFHTSLDEDFALPVKMVRDALKASSKVARETFLKWTTGGTDTEAMLLLVPADLRDTFRKALRAHDEGNAVDSLIAVAAWAKKQKADARGQAKGARTLLDEIEAPGFPVTDEQIDNLRAEVNQIQDLISQSEKVTEVSGLYKRLTSVNESLAGLEHRKALIEQSIAATEDVIHQSRKTFIQSQQVTPMTGEQRAEHELALDIIDGVQGDTCPVCCNYPAHIADAYEHHTNALAAATPARWEDDCEEADRLLGLLAADEADLQVVEDEISDKRDDLSFICRRLGELGYDPAGEPVDAPNAVNMDADLKRAETRRDDAIAAKATWDQLESARTRARSMDKQVERYADIEKISHEVIAGLLRKNVGAFVEAVTDNLPVGWSFSLTLVNEKGKDTFEWAVDKSDDKDHFALSGSEFETVVMAIAETVMQVNDYAGPALIKPADRGWSPTTLADLTEALARSTCQVLIESTVAPAYEVDGWTYIYLDAPMRESLGDLGVDTNQTIDVGFEVATKRLAAPDDISPDDETQEISTAVPDNLRPFLSSLGWRASDIDVMTEAAARDIIRNGRRQ